MLKNFHELDETSQSFLEFASFVFEPMTQTLLGDRFNRYLASQGELHRGTDYLVGQLKNQQLLEPVGEKIRCRREILEEVSTHAAVHGRAEAMCKLSKGPSKTGQDAVSKSLKQESFAEARRALYRGDTETFLTLFRRMEEWRKHYPHFENYVSFTELLDKGICSQEPLNFYPDEVRMQILMDGLYRSMLMGEPAEHLWSCLQALCKNGKELDEQAKELHSHQVLLRDLDQELTSPFDQLGNQTVNGTLQGVSDLTRLFCGGQYHLKFPFLVQEFLYIVACYAHESWNLIKERHEQAHAELRPWLVWFWQIRQGERTDLDPQLQELWQSPDLPPLQRALSAFFLYWAGFASLLEPAQILRLSERFEQASYTILSRELRALGQLLNDSSSEETDFLGLLEPTALWKSTLKQMEAWVENHSEKEESRRAEERVVWILDLDSTRSPLQAKVQKVGKTGRWTQGRRVELKNLHSQAKPCLDEHDKKVLSTWALMDLTDYTEDSVGELVCALLGHPRVYSPEGIHLDLQEGKPRLVVQEKESTLHLKLNPEFPQGRSVGVMKVTQNRYQAVVIDEQLASLNRIVPRGGLELPLEETERIQKILALVTRSGVSVEGTLAGGGDIETREADGRIKVRLYPYQKGLRSEVGVEPAGAAGPFCHPGDGHPYFLTTQGDSTLEFRRDLEQEKVLWSRVLGYLPAFRDGDFCSAEPTECLELLETLRVFSQDEVVVEWPQGKALSLGRILHWSQVRLSVSKDRDWFSLSAELETGEDEHLKLMDLVERHRQQKSRFIVLEDGEYIALTKTFERRIKALQQAAAKEEEGHFLLHPLTGSILLGDQEIQDVDGLWESTKQRLATAQKIEPTLPSKFAGELRPYQKEGYDFLVRSAAWGVGACLADDMGLGKTVQILALLAERAADGPALVVAPTSVCSNWRAEAHRFAPDLKVSILSESDRTALLRKAGAGELIICSYGLLCNEVKHLKAVHWNTLVLDESQAIKNLNTKRFKAAIALDANFRVAATGTPVENQLGELWALFRFLNPGLLGGHARFAANYMADSEDEGVMENLKNLVSPFILRRLKRDVLKDLPPKTEINVEVELTGDERLYYESLRLSALERIEDNEQNVIGILAELMRLRRVCCHPRLVDPQTKLGSSKFDRFFELLTDLLEAKHRVLVFSQFVGHLHLIRDELDLRQISYQYLDGSTPARKRTEAVEEFQEGLGECFLISLKAGGTGLNLTAANYVIHLDPWWNPAAEDQASDRAHRIGQTEAVTVYRLVTTNTIEEKILALHKEKRELVDTLLSGTDKAGKLSSEELLGLLRESAFSTV